MVDWATRDRLYPAGYHATNVRYRRTTIDASLPFSLAMNQSIRFAFQSTRDD